MCIGVFCSLQLFHSLKRPFHRYNSLLLRIPILRTEPVILLALHNADLAHRVHAAACPITKLGIIGVWFIVCSTGLAAERGIQPIKHRCGLLTGDGLVRSECSVIIAGYNTERRCQTDTLVLAVGKGRCRSHGGIQLHLLIQLDRQSAEIHARDIQPGIIERKRNIMFPSGFQLRLGPAAFLRSVSRKPDFTAFAVQLVKRGAALADVAAVRPAELVEVVPADKLAGFVNQTVRFVADCSFSGTNPQSIGIRPFVKCGVDAAPQAPSI